MIYTCSNVYVLLSTTDSMVQEKKCTENKQIFALLRKIDVYCTCTFPGKSYYGITT